MVAVGELEPEYEGRIQFNVISAEETMKRQDEIDAFGFTDQKHGMVGFSSDGEAIVLIPGHQFGKPEIEAAAQTLLASES